MDKAVWRERFRLEQASLAEELAEDLSRLGRDELFRFFHSLRSQAEFFHWDELSREARKGESALAALPEDGKLPAGPFRDRLLALLNILQENQGAPLGTPGGEGAVLRRGTGGLALRQIKPFAFTLLREARDRGENPYHIHCRISDQEPLPYARFFLIVSRLEEVINVIQVFPELKTLEENPGDGISLLVTARAGEDEIRRAVDVDNLERLSFKPLTYEDLLSPRYAPEPSKRPEDSARSQWQGRQRDRSLLISVQQVEAMENAVQELRHRILSDPRRIAWRGEALRDIRSLERALGQVEMVSLEGLFQYLPEMSQDLAEQAGKQVELTVQGEGHEVDWTVMDPLFEVLLQLLRNAVDHGIEPPEERKRQGKDPLGRISVTAVRQGDSLRLQVMDDGAGIALPGEDLGEEALLNQLARPGYTTREETGAISGRGVGLDLAVRRVRDLLGGTMTLHSSPGEGSVFQITLPSRSHVQDLAVFRAEGQYLALPGRAVMEILDLGEESIQREEDGGLFVRTGRGRIPLYSASGRLMSGEESHVSYPRAAVITHLGLEGALGVDALMEERQVFSREVRMGYEREPHIHELALEGYDEPVLFVFPSLISRY